MLMVPCMIFAYMKYSEQVYSYRYQIGDSQGLEGRELSDLNMVIYDVIKDVLELGRGRCTKL